MISSDPLPVPQEPGKTQFDYDYRKNVIPRLNRLAIALAKQIVRGDISYDQASCRLCLRAVRLGGAYVSDWDDLEDYLVSLLADFTDEGLRQEDL